MNRTEAAKVPRIRTVEPADLSWTVDAACKGLDEDGTIFFPQYVTDVAQAKAICNRCPVQQECLSYALDRPELNGIWGGYGEQGRGTLRRARQRRDLATRSASRTPAPGTSG